MKKKIFIIFDLVYALIMAIFAAMFLALSVKEIMISDWSQLFLSTLGFVLTIGLAGASFVVNQTFHTKKKEITTEQNPELYINSDPATEQLPVVCGVCSSRFPFANGEEQNTRGWGCSADIKDGVLLCYDGSRLFDGSEYAALEEADVETICDVCISVLIRGGRITYTGSCFDESSEEEQQGFNS